MLGSQSPGIKKLQWYLAGILTASLASTAAMRPFAITTVEFGWAAVRGQGEAHATNARTWMYGPSAAEQGAERCGTERHGRR
jgi:hypothetical protein